MCFAVALRDFLLADLAVPYDHKVAISPFPAHSIIPLRSRCGLEDANQMHGWFDVYSPLNRVVCAAAGFWSNEH